MATAVAKQGSAEGFKALKSMCDDRGRSPSLRMSAAQEMGLFLGRRHECFSDVLEVLCLPADQHDANRIALGILRDFLLNSDQVAPNQLDEIRNVSTVYLKSPEPDFRKAASDVVSAV